MEIGLILSAVGWTLPAAALALLAVAVFGARVTPLAAAAGIYLTYRLVYGWPAWPHELWASPKATEWLLWSVIAAGVLASGETLGLLRARSAMILAVPLAASATWLVLQRVVARWPAAERWLTLAGVAAAIVAATWLLRRLWLVKAHPAAPALLAAFALFVDATLLGLGHTALLAQLAGTLSAVVAMAMVPLCWRAAFVFTAGQATWLAFAHVLFLVAGVRIADVTWSAALLAGLAPGAGVAVQGLLAQRPRAWIAVALLLQLAMGAMALVAQAAA